MLEQQNISIIIPVKNAERTIPQMFDSIVNLEYPKNKMEVIIVDGGSTDRTVSIIQEKQNLLPMLKIMLIQLQHSKSPGEARNAALKVASGKYLFFTDADCAPAPNWIKSMLAAFLRDPKIGGVGGEILTLRIEKNNLVELYCEKTKFLSPTGRCKMYQSGYMPALKEKVPTVVDGSNRSPFFATANAAFSAEAIRAAGGEFWQEITGEDVDFCLRILSAGYKLYFVKESVVYHMHRATLKDYLKQVYHYGYGHPLLLSKHADPVFEVAVQFLGEERIYQFNSEKPGLVNLGDFHWMHIFGAFTLLSVFISGYMALPFTLMTLIFGGKYFAPIAKISGPSQWVSFAGIRYLSNLSFIRGAIAGQKKFGPVVIEPSW